MYFKEPYIHCAVVKMRSNGFQVWRMSHKEKLWLKFITIPEAFKQIASAKCPYVKRYYLCQDLQRAVIYTQVSYPLKCNVLPQAFHNL